MSVTSIDTTRRRALAFTPMETNWRAIVEAAIHAEEVGYEAIVVPEGWALDGPTVLSEIARQTSRIRLASGILSVWGRSAATLAMTAATLDEISDGRFTLGLGASTPALVEGIHGHCFERSSVQLAETVQKTRTLLDGQRATRPDGSAGLRLGLNPRPHLPLWVAGLGPKAVATAVRAADGWFPALVPLSAMPTIRQAATADGPTECTLVAGPLSFIRPDNGGPNPAAQQLLGWYLTGMGRFYGDFVASQGFAAEIAAIRDANPKPKPGAITWPSAADSLLNELTAHGDPDELASQLQAWDSQSDLVAVTTGPAPIDELHRLIAAGAPDVTRQMPTVVERQAAS